MSAPIASKEGEAEWPDWKYVEASLSLYKRLGTAHWEQPHKALVHEVLRLRDGLEVIQGVLEQPNGCHRYVDGFHAKDCPACDLLASVRHVLKVPA